MENEGGYVKNGLEGVCKSEDVNKKAVEVATTERPVLFAYKNYKQLRENRDRLIKNHKVKKYEICVCGVTKYNEEAMISYTNKNKPQSISENAKYVMCSQAVLQRGLHKTFYPKKNYSLIVVDEVDFGLIAIPTLNYQLSRIAGNKTKLELLENVREWVAENYSKDDVNNVMGLALSDGNDRYKNFITTQWLEDNREKTIFITSETLPTEFLKILGFKSVHLESPSFKQCIVNSHVSPHIVGEFYDVMNRNDGWSMFSKHYDVVASDRYKPTNDGKDLKLEQDLMVLNHTVLKGTNSLIGKKMLTIMSHVPPQTVDKIYDMFCEFGRNVDRELIYKSFYRDRLCQSLGRVLGHRGGTETDLLIHKTMFDHLKDYEGFPYTFNPNYVLPCEELTTVIEKTIELRKRNKQRRNENDKKKAEERLQQSYEMLDEHFIKKKGSKIVAKQLTEYLRSKGIKSKYGTKNIPVKAVVNYFGVQLKQIMINGERQQYVLDLAFKKQ